MIPHVIARKRSTMFCFVEKNFRQSGRVARIRQMISKMNASVIPISQRTIIGTNSVTS